MCWQGRHSRWCQLCKQSCCWEMSERMHRGRCVVILNTAWQHLVGREEEEAVGDESATPVTVPPQTAQCTRALEAGRPQSAQRNLAAATIAA